MNKTEDHKLNSIKILLSIIFSISFFSSCRISSDVTKEYEENPCNDAQYVILKKMEPSELTSGQIEYLKLKDKECEKFSKDHSKHNLEKKQADSNLIWILSGIGLILVAGILIGIAFRNGSWH